MYCLNCGAYVSERDSECYMCGSSVSAQRETLIRIKRQQNALEPIKKELRNKYAEAEEASRQEAIRSEAERLEAVKQAALKFMAESQEVGTSAAERYETECLVLDTPEKIRQEAARREAERLEAERLEKERQEAARREAERLEAERLEKERQEAARREAERLEAERLEKERQEAARREAESLEAERLEKERQEEARREEERKKKAQQDSVESISNKPLTTVLFEDEVPKGVINPTKMEKNQSESAADALSSPPNYLPERYNPKEEDNNWQGRKEDGNKREDRRVFKETKQEKSSYPPQPPVSTSGTVNRDSQNDIIMKIFCFVAAAVYGWQGLSGLFGWVYSIPYTLGALLRNPAGYVIILLSSILGLAVRILALAAAGLFVVAALRWTREKAEVYFAVTAEVIVVRVLAVFLSAVFSFLGYRILYRYSYFTIKPTLFTVLYGAVTLGLYYGANALCGAMLFKGMDGDQVREIFTKAPSSVISALRTKKEYEKSAGGQSEEQKPVMGDTDKKERVRPDYSWDAQNSSPHRDISYTGNSSSGSMALKTDRSLLSYIILGFLTCGIYQWYMLHNIAKEVNIACEGDGKQTAGLLKLIVFTILTCGIYSWIWFYNLGNRLQENAPRYGLHFSENGTTILMWELFGILLCGIGPFIAMNILLNNTNSICAAYNRENGF